MNYEDTTSTPDVTPIATGKPDRPFALKVVCALLMFYAILLLSVVALSVVAAFSPSTTATIDARSISWITGIGLVAELILIAAAGVILFSVSLGLWRLNPWAWRWTMIVVGSLLVFNLWNYFRDNESVMTTITVLIDVLIVFYLVQPDVRRLYIDKPKDSTPPFTP